MKNNVLPKWLDYTTWDSPRWKTAIAQDAQNWRGSVAQVANGVSTSAFKTRFDIHKNFCKQEEVKANLIKAFPTLLELEEYLQVVIGRPLIIPALSEQLNSEQANCLQQITQFIQQYDQNLEQRLREAAVVGGEQLAAQLLEELADWQPGRKPVQFKRQMSKHLQKVRVLLANASPKAGGSLQQMMEHLDSISV